ncbi:MAG: hypothetical protein RR612_01830, partial [Oscillospiraceae bacterium]
MAMFSMILPVSVKIYHIITNGEMKKLYSKGRMNSGKLFVMMHNKPSVSPATKIAMIAPSFFQSP